MPHAACSTHDSPRRCTGTTRSAQAVPLELQSATTVGAPTGQRYLSGACNVVLFVRETQQDAFGTAPDLFSLGPMAVRRDVARARALSSTARGSAGHRHGRPGRRSAGRPAAGWPAAEARRRRWRRPALRAPVATSPACRGGGSSIRALRVARPSLARNRSCWTT